MDFSANYGYDLAIETFRALPCQAKRKLTIGKVRYVLQHKLVYYSNLPYKTKCRCTTEYLVGVLYRRLKNKGLGLGKASIRHILLAEEYSYTTLHAVYQN